MDDFKFLPKFTGYQEAELIVPTSQITIANIKPNYSLIFHNNHEGGTGKQVGKFDFNGPEMIFEGNTEESAKVFVDWVANAFHGRLEEERKSELDACCNLLEGMHATTNGDHNYYLHAANELRKMRNIK
jgi:hypothetical protein